MKDRDMLVKSLIPVDGIAAELGVAKGVFSDVILKLTKCSKLFSIDRWAGDRGHNSNEETQARTLLQQHGKRSEVVKASFHDIVNFYEDEYFDFIYIDGYAHTGQEQGLTLEEWWPKLKPGGIFAGHDYHRRWPTTVDAVNCFAGQYDKIINLTEEDGPGLYPSWYFLK